MNSNDIFNSNYIRKELEKNPFASVSNLVYNALEDAIWTSKLMPGEKLVISKLASQLGVSTTPVREAIDQLAERGLVTIELKDTGKQNVYKVFDLKSQDIKELHLARKAIDGAVAYWCAENNWLVDTEKLSKLAYEFKKQQEQYAKQLSPRRPSTTATSVDRSFHDLLLKSTNNSYLIESYRQLEKKLAYLSIVSAYKLSNEESDYLIKMGSQHIAISNAIRDGYPEQARRLMEDHVDFCMTLFMNYI